MKCLPKITKIQVFLFTEGKYIKPSTRAKFGWDGGVFGFFHHLEITNQIPKFYLYVLDKMKKFPNDHFL